ncbi:hypothetical protein H4R33_006294, partial [Dimargaris cristalligena]
PHIQTILNHGNEVRLNQRILSVAQRTTPVQWYDLASVVLPHLVAALGPPDKRVTFASLPPPLPHTRPPLDPTRRFVSNIPEPASLEILDIDPDTADDLAVLFQKHRVEPARGPASWAPHSAYSQPTATAAATLRVQPPATLGRSAVFQPIGYRLDQSLSAFLKTLRQAVGPTILANFHRHTRWRDTFRHFNELFYLLDGTLLAYFHRQFFDLPYQRTTTTTTITALTSSKDGSDAAPQRKALQRDNLLLSELNSILGESLHQHPVWRRYASHVHITGTQTLALAKCSQVRPHMVFEVINQLTMEFELPPITQAIFPAAFMRDCQAIQRLLWQVKFAHHTLSRLDFLKPLRLAGYASGPQRRDHAARVQRRQAMQSANQQLAIFYRIRMKLFAAVNGLQYYLMTATLHVACQRMVVDLDQWFKAETTGVSLTHIVENLTQFTHELLHKCLLDQKSAVIMKHLSTLLQLVPRFQELFANFNHILATYPSLLGTPLPAHRPSLTEQSAVDMRDRIMGQVRELDLEYTRIRDFLVNVLQISAKHPGLDSLHVLVMSLSA